MSLNYNTAFIIAVSVLLFLLGSVMGSFLECLADRSVKGVSIITKGRSYCPSCNHTLSPFDLVPIWSWIFLGGRCRYCRKKIPARHLVTELIMAVCYVLIFLRFGLGLEMLEYLFLFSVLLPAALIDIQTQTLPDGYFITAAIGWAVFTALGYILPNGSALFITPAVHDMTVMEILKEAALGGLAIPAVLLIISVVMDKILKKDTLGGGDIKLLFATGLYLGFWKNFLTVWFACIIGLIFVLIAKKKDKTFPFGPSIVAATFICAMAGDYIINTYTSLVF